MLSCRSRSALMSCRATQRRMTASRSRNRVLVDEYSACPGKSRRCQITSAIVNRELLSEVKAYLCTPTRQWRHSQFASVGEIGSLHQHETEAHVTAKSFQPLLDLAPNQ